MTVRFLAFLSALLAVATFAAQPAQARDRDRGEAVIWHSVVVPAGRTVDGDLDVVFGDAQVAGTVRGDCNTIFGRCTIVDGGQVLGEVHSVSNDGLRALVPWAIGREYGISALAEQNHRLLVKLGTSAVVVVVFLLFPLRMRVALDRVERHPGLAAVTGAIAFVAVIPLAILLVVTIVGIPLVVLEAAALFAGLWIGAGAIALLVGRRLCELVMPRTTPSPLLALILGLVVVCSAEIVPYVGWAVTALVWLVGLGATILSFVRSTQLDGAVHRVPLGGPPARYWR